MDGETLVTGLQHGDPRSLEYAVQHCAPALYRFAYFQLGDAATAEDLVSGIMYV